MAQLTSTTIYGNLQVTLDAVVGGILSLTDTTAATSKTTGAMTIAGGLGVAGDIWSTKYNDLTLTKQTTGFTIAGGTTSKTLTVNGDATVSGTNTGNQTITSGNGMNFTSGSGSVTITLGGPSDITSSSGNSVTATSHTHAIVGEALTKTDDTNVTLTLGGAHAAGLVKATSLTLGWSGQLALSRGGSNANLTAASGGIVYSTSTAMAIKAAGTAGQALLSGGTAAPTWTTGTLTLDKNLTISTGNVTLAGQAAGSSVTLPASGTLVPDSRKVAGMALSSDITLKTLTISSPLSGTSYNGSTAVSIGLASGYGDTQNPYGSQTANYFLAAPNGAAGAPAFRAIVAADIPTLNQSTSGNAATATTASKVASSLVLKFDTGTTPDTDIYTFDGSAAKTIDIKGGTNVTLTKAAGVITINSSYVNTTYTADTGLSLTGTAFSVKYGTAAGTACQGNDSRLSDARTPTSHTHGDITNDGKVGTTTDQVVVTGTGGAITTASRSGIDSRSSFPPSSHTHSYAGSSSAGGAADSTKAAVTFTNDGTGYASGTSFNGSAVRTISYNTIGAAASTHTHAATDITSGTLAVDRGGTGTASFTTGAIIYASATTTLAGLADVATGSALISGGVGAAPSWGKIDLSTHVSGTLPISSGGTGASSVTARYSLLGPTSAGAPTWRAITSADVSDATSANTASTIVARDTQGNFSAGQITCTSINTGPGATEVHLMDQNVRTTDNVTFGTLTCSTINTGQGATEVYKETFYETSGTATVTINLPAMAIGETLHFNIALTSGSSKVAKICYPAGGTYIPYGPIGNYVATNGIAGGTELVSFTNSSSAQTRYYYGSIRRRS